MARRVGLTQAVQSLVQTEVAAVAKTYRTVRERLASFVAEARLRPRNSIVAERSANPFAETKRRARSKKVASRGAPKLGVGGRVSYRQGSGTFEAKVVAVDADKGVAVLERIKDGKRVTRPMKKVIV